MTDALNDVREVTAATERGTQPLYWAVRRELWENRSLYMAPLLVAGFVLIVSILFNTSPLGSRLERAAALSPAKQREIVTMPLSAVAGSTIFVAFLVGFFYCLDALYGERRDRSILFWKSLPVSDRTTVLAKASIPMLVLPLFVFVIVVTTQTIMVVLNTLRLLGNGSALALLWSHLKFFQMTAAFLYGLIIIALWHAPVYAWLLLVSGRVKHAAVLWAIVPFLAVGAVERLLFNTTTVLHGLGYRLTGWYHRGFVFPPKGTTVAWDPFAHLTPGKYLSSPGLWVGLLFTALFLALAVRVRRNREPI